MGMFIIAITACTGDVVAPANTIAADKAWNSRDVVTFWESGASVYWNSVARDLVVKYKSSPFAALRGYALVSHAQYSAIIAAQNAQGQLHPSAASAIAHASVVTLKYLYPAEETTLNSLLAAQLAVPGWIHPHKVALLEQSQIVLGRDETGEIRGELRGVGQDSHGFGVAEHLPGLLVGVVMHLTPLAGFLQPGQKHRQRGLRRAGRHEGSSPGRSPCTRLQ